MIDLVGMGKGQRQDSKNEQHGNKQRGSVPPKSKFVDDSESEENSEMGDLEREKFVPAVEEVVFDIAPKPLKKSVFGASPISVDKPENRASFFDL